MSVRIAAVTYACRWKPRRFSCALAVLVAGLAVAACGGGDAGGGGTGDGEGRAKVVFGADTQLSGDLQIYGLPAELGLKLGAASINEAGGIEVEGEAHDAEAYVADNRSDPSAIAAAARDVLDHGAVAALAPDLGEQVAYNVWKNKLIVWAGSFVLQGLLQEAPDENPLLFAVTPFLSELYSRDVKQAKILFPDIKRVAILAPDSEEGKGALESYKAGTQQAGLELVSAQLYAPSTTDFASLLTSVKGKSPDLLIALQSPDQALAILQQAADLGVAKYGLNDTMLPDRVLESKGLANMTVIIPNFSPTFSPAATVPDYEPGEIFQGEKAPDNAGGVITMWYAWQIMAKAVREAGTATDPKAIADKLIGQSYDGPFGTCKVSDRRAMECETVVFVVANGAIDVNRFPGPDATAPSNTYECRDGKCTAAK